jgi:CRP/FNR family cyclic AMP-dependent transcriptional regulator
MSASSPSAPVDPLAGIQLFSQLSAPERGELAGQMTTATFGPNQTVFWLGDQGDAFYVVRQGQVAVTVPSDGGEHVTLDTLGPGGFFGEISLLDGGPRTATIRTLLPCELLVLTRERFHAFLQQRPDVAIEILSVMGQRQRSSTQALRNLKNANEVFAQSQVTLWQRASDVAASVAASQWFTLFHLVWFGSWVLVNLIGALVYTGTVNVPEEKVALLPPWVFDPFPFGLLTMVVSLEAIFLSIFVMVSQNRQGEKDRLRTDLDHQVNVKAQTEIMNIVRRLEALERWAERIELPGKR